MRYISKNSISLRFLNTIVVGFYKTTRFEDSLCVNIGFASLGKVDDALAGDKSRVPGGVNLAVGQLKIDFCMCGTINGTANGLSFRGTLIGKVEAIR